MLSNGDEVRRLVYLTIFLCLLSACTTTLGTKTPYGQASLTKMKKVGVFVKKEEDFSVRVAREQEVRGGILTIGVVGKAIESSIRTGIDEKLTAQLKPEVQNYNIVDVVSEKIFTHLQHANVFSSIEKAENQDTSTLQKKNADGILEITIKEWGLRLCAASDNKVQAGVNIQTKIFSFEQSAHIFEHNKTYVFGECFLREDLRAREGLLITLLTQVVDHASQRIVDEIRFP